MTTLDDDDDDDELMHDDNVQVWTSHIAVHFNVDKTCWSSHCHDSLNELLLRMCCSKIRSWIWPWWISRLALRT